MNLSAHEEEVTAMKRIASLILCIILVLNFTGAFAAELNELINPYAESFCTQYTLFTLLLCDDALNDINVLDNLAFSTGNIRYFSSDARKGYTGQKVADGGAMNELGTCTIGVGAGIDNEDLWYVTNTYSGGLDYQTLLISAVAMCMASNGLGVNLGTDIDEVVNTSMQLAKMLISCTETTAYQLDDVVYLCKLLDNRSPLEGGMFILGVESLDFYNEFYYGSVENYYVFE